MQNAAAVYADLISHLETAPGVAVSQMFGKACLKVNGKAFVALHLETLAFKLAGTDHAAALALPGAASGDVFSTLSDQALAYAATLA